MEALASYKENREEIPFGVFRATIDDAKMDEKMFGLVADLLAQLNA